MIHHHEVVAGDTLYGIAKRYSSTVAAIQVANSWIPNINLIKTGWVLHVIGTDTPPAPTVTLGYPVYTQAERDSWSTNSPEYTRLANSSLGKVAWAYSVPPAVPAHEGAVMDAMNNAAAHAKVQAVLWVADALPARLARVREVLDKFGAITQWEGDANARLDLGWHVTNLCQAGAITDHPVDRLRPYLDLAEGHMQWWSPTNWAASFADSRLARAAFLRDESELRDAAEFFHWWIARSIYHSRHDGPKVVACVGYHPASDWPGCKTKPPHQASTLATWNAQGTQIAADYTAINVPDGADTERLRDLSHENMALQAWVHGARTIRAGGLRLELHAYDRIRAMADLLAGRCLRYATTGVIPAPVPKGGDGGGGWKMNWRNVRKFLGPDTPQAVHDLLGQATIKAESPSGSLHMVASPFADT